MLYFADNQHVINSLLFYQDFKDTFVCNTQPTKTINIAGKRCFIRISKILLYAIHNLRGWGVPRFGLFYQDFKDTFVCNTQLLYRGIHMPHGCFIRISKILLYAIHNACEMLYYCAIVVLSGFQRYFCMQYTTEW